MRPSCEFKEQKLWYVHIQSLRHWIYWALVINTDLNVERPINHRAPCTHTFRHSLEPRRNFHEHMDNQLNGMVFQRWEVTENLRGKKNKTSWSGQTYRSYGVKQGPWIYMHICMCMGAQCCFHGLDRTITWNGSNTVVYYLLICSQDSDHIGRIREIRNQFWWTNVIFMVQYNPSLLIKDQWVN